MQALGTITNNNNLLLLLLLAQFDNVDPIYTKPRYSNYSNKSGRAVKFTLLSTYSHELLTWFKIVWLKILSTIAALSNQRRVQFSSGGCDNSLTRYSLLLTLNFTFRSIFTHVFKCLPTHECRLQHPLTTRPTVSVACSI